MNLDWVPQPLWRALYWLLKYDQVPDYPIDEELAAQFEALFADAVARGPNWTIDYRLPAPKWAFLDYLVRYKGAYLHGSPVPDIPVLAPREQTTWNGRPIRAVFASQSPVFPIFYAVIDKQRCRQMRNAAYRVRNAWYYSFSIPLDSLRGEPYVPGTIYILSGESFTPGEVSAEGYSRVPVVPIARLPVTAADFPLLERMEGHDPGVPFVQFLLSRFVKQPVRREML